MLLKSAGKYNRKGDKKRLNYKQIDTVTYIKAQFAF